MEKNNQEYPLLIAQSGPLEGQRWKIKSELLLGRDSDCDVVIPMRQVSRQHARIFKREGGTLVEDLNSKNGTYVNGHHIEDIVRLEEGDEIQVSLAQHFIYLSSDATMPLEALPVDMQKRRLRVDIGARRIWILDKELDPPLSASQFNLLRILCEQSGEVVARSEIIQAVWGKAAEGVTEQALDALVRRLRDRLAEVDPIWDYIVTVRGHGLRLDNPAITQAA
ncbi:MAG: FHA domain-containing protein [Brevefilum sp.]|nr:FHA domain-containing protein [Brevefilum sp.]MDT8380914.1 FHA domain-containing protein [Brevefilum sp.]MDW7754230.1 FHA domain-containing protein [Brevefilum sp.]